MDTWEYEVLYVTFDKDTNRWSDGVHEVETFPELLDPVGADGWELDNVVAGAWQLTEHTAMFGAYVCFLKRRNPE